MNVDKKKEAQITGLASSDMHIVDAIREGRSPEMGSGFTSSEVVYTTIRDRIMVEYGVCGYHVVFQITPPSKDIKYWENINNRDIYKNLFSIIDEHGLIPQSIKKQVGAPTNTFKKITIVFENLATIPFYESFVKRAAEALASRLY